MSVITNNTIQPSSGQALTIKDEGGTASITVQTDGDLTLAENAYLGSGKGIYFDGQTTSENFLDDYEEGTWTGKIRFGSSSGTSNGSATGVYTKIGRNVTVSIQITLDNATNGSGQVYLTGLPFNSVSGYNSAGSLMVNDYMDATRVSPRVSGGQSHALFYIHPNSHSTGLASWTTTYIHSNTGGKAIGITVTYPSS